jgi:uncharacterized protein (DUF488 family)
MNENDRISGKTVSPRGKGAAAPAILTIGHSNRSIDEFIEMLRAHSVERLFDVRTIPRSRHNPQFNSDALADSLCEAGIEYFHLPELGGLRHASKDSINTAWKNSSFRGYADYMQTPEFDAALARLIEAASEKCSVIMCAEAVPWRCHRSLVADALSARGIAAEHIMSRTNRNPHSLTPFASVDGVRVTYPAKGESGTLRFD